jgi:hypothetical protein
VSNARMTKSCFNIFKDRNGQMTQASCHMGDISLEEIQDHQYMLNESLINEKTNNQILMSKTNNFMPHFLDNFFKYSEFVVRKMSRHESIFGQMELRQMLHKRKINPRLRFLN